MTRAPKGLVACTLALSLIIPGTALADSATWMCLWGETRYDTMAAIVEEGFASSPCVVVASGEDYPDALSASALAGVMNCPIVLTSRNELSRQTAEQIDRLRVTRAYVVGGPAAIDENVEAAFESMGVAVTRVAGPDRRSTSVEMLHRVREAGSTSETVVVASGVSFADALSISPWAYSTASSIVLTRSDGTLDEQTVKAVREAGFSEAILVGGTSMVSDAVAEQLGDGIETTRLGGADRYDTSARIAAWELEHGLTWERPALASGTRFPDALAGSALCGKHGSPILLTDDEYDATVRMIEEHEGQYEKGFYLGSVNARYLEGNSHMVDLIVLSPNTSGPRLYPITKITPHYMSEQWSAEKCGRSFLPVEREASSNYGIGLDGEVGLYVPEAYRAWTSSNSDNDNRAVTIECANLEDDSLTDATWDALVDLCVDICQRNGIKRLVFTGDATGNLTMHKYFNPKTVCPGPWLSAQFDLLANEVNARLGVG